MPAASSTSTTATTGTRLVGLDVARALALLGMVATHVLLTRTPTGDLSLAHAVAGGRASALFAVLAGVSVALISGRRQPVVGGERVRVSAALAIRAVLVATIGLLLGGLDTGIAVILTYYGVLFLLGLPFLGLRSRALFALAGAWVVAGPVISLVVRPELPARGVDSPSLSQLGEPGHLVSELLLTGYYPALLWLAYLLVGMAVGRLDLRSQVVQVRLVLLGFALAVVATVASAVATRAAGFTDADLDAVAGGMFGQTPTDDWRWQLVVAPHSTTPFDLAQTIGSALVVIGLCLLLVDRVTGLAGRAAERVVAIAFGAGTMTLTLYTLHLLMLTPQLPPAEEPGTFVIHVLVLVWVGAAFVAVGRRGPLERLVGHLPGLVRGRAGTVSRR